MIGARVTPMPLCQIVVRVPGRSKPYRASVPPGHVSPECELAALCIAAGQEEDFWSHVTPLPLGRLPQLLDRLEVSWAGL